MSTTPTVVLVHGAFADASGYGGVIRRLQAEGLAVRAPMNPLRGLAFDADAIARYMTSIEGPVLLVGHSYGGAVISHAALAVTDVAGLVFLSAFALDVGESCASLQEPFPPSLLASTSVPSPYDAPGAAGGPDLFIKIEEFHRTFCADLPADLAATMAVSQRPLSVAALTEKATVAGWKDLPSWYLVSAQDNAIPGLAVPPSTRAAPPVSPLIGPSCSSIAEGRRQFPSLPDEEDVAMTQGVTNWPSG
jgi:pimeloyl-ACP methyl ester carboxylesterase